MQKMDVQAIDVPDPVDNFICETPLRTVENLRQTNVAIGVLLSIGRWNIQINLNFC